MSDSERRRVRAGSHGSPGYRLAHYYPHALTVDTGPNRAIWGWASAVSDLGVSVRILHTGGAGSRSEQVPCVPVRSFGYRRWFVPVGLTRLLGKGDILVLHSGYVLHNIAAAMSARRAGIPFIVVPHGAYAGVVRRRRRFLRSIWELMERRLLQSALAVHVFYDAEEEDVMRLAPRVRCVVAPIGVELPERKWTGGGGYLAWLGRYDVHVKGLDWLVDAVAELPPKDRPVIRLRGIDDKQRRQEIERMASRAQVETWVKAEPPIHGDEKIDFLVAADAYIHPSRAEAQSLALMEALSLGIPAIASRSVNSATTLEEAHAALLLDMDVTGSLARALRALEDQKLVLSEAARRVISSEYSWEHVTRRFVEQVDALLSPVGTP